MKRKEFVRQLKKDGCILLRPGARHDISMNPHYRQETTCSTETRLGRHTEIDNSLVKHIRKHFGLE